MRSAVHWWGFVNELWIYSIERSFAGYFIHPVKEPGITLDRVLTDRGGVLAVLAVCGLCMTLARPTHPMQRFLAGWAGVNLLAIVIFREFEYVVPSLAIVGTFALERPWRWLGSYKRSVAFAGGCALLLVLLFAFRATTSFEQVQFARARGERGPGGGLSQPEELGRIINRDTPRGSMFVYGNAAELYAITGRLPATPYLNAEADQ
ncbi:MAG: hypothetical protein JOZ81_25515 [Chloroflexi bacterium]|nr:hypothetical protein [Chloroflexota bacterium]